jgi:hypothetical protein
MAGPAWRRLLQRIAGSSPTYPEYKEYRDKDDYDARWEEEERPTEAVGGGTDDFTAKMARLKLAAGFVLFLCLGASVYLYYVKPAAPGGAANLREAATTEALRRTAMGADGAGREESLDDIKRWASDVTRRAEREITDTFGAGRASPPIYGQGSGVPTGAALPWVPPAVVAPMTWDTTSAAYSEMLSAPSSSASGTPSTYSTGGTSYEPPPPASSTRRVPSQYDPPTPTPPPSTAPSYSVSRDTADRPYHPRRYEPVVIEPRVVEPY